MDYEKIFNVRTSLLLVGVIFLFNTLVFMRERYIAEGLNGVLDVFMLLITGAIFVVIVQQIIKPKEKEKEVSVFDYEDDLLKNNKRKN